MHNAITGQHQYAKLIMLENINRLLRDDKLTEGITALEQFLRRQPGGLALRQRLAKLKAEIAALDQQYAAAEISEEEHRSAQAILKRDLLELLRGIEQTYNRPSAPASAPTRPRGGGLLDRALEAIRKRWPRSTRDRDIRPPSPRIPSKPKEIDEMVVGPVEEEFPMEATPPEEAMEGEPPSPPTSAPPPQTPSAPAPTSPTQIGGVQNPFQAGKILYAIPPSMKLSEPVRCRIRIATQALEDSVLESGLSEEEKDNATREGIQITSVMKVELEEAHDQGNSFEIVARNTAEQPILPFMPTEWTFDVTPKRPGHYALLLRVTAKVQIPGFGERPFDVAVLDRAIQVTTTGEAVDLDAFEEQPIPDPSWDDADEEAVHQALRIGRVDRAIERIINFVQDKDSDFHSTLLLLQFRWSDNSNQLQQQLISASDWDVVNNRVRLSITKLLAELRQNFSSAVATSDVDWKTLNADLQTELQ
ncbi:MAG: hypothetical protein AAFN81_33925 [Bacteroidota bacterium]